MIIQNIGGKARYTSSKRSTYSEELWDGARQAVDSMQRAMTLSHHPLRFQPCVTIAGARYGVFQTRDSLVNVRQEGERDVCSLLPLTPGIIIKLAASIVTPNAK